MPWHWGYEGLSRGDVVNELTALVGDPNVSDSRGKDVRVQRGKGLRGTSHA
jgi:hypothetical protein